ncbi:MAG: MBL fold metallo-hydrolase [Candidatus Hadarchaeota archaeon]|nr:MBL fold metallo-hydrolase [Candidatus Hadarchaeota archaeon]
MIELVFLGAGGGRYMTADQHFKTGGFRLHTQAKIHIDPGPGALLLTHQLGLNPLDLDCVVASHCHPDHYADAEVLVEAMTQHMTRESGVLVGSESVLHGKGKWGPAISDYHQGKAGRVICMKPGDSLELRDLKLEATPTKHSDPTTFGLRFHSQSGIIGYTNDTEYFEELSNYFRGSRVLILNITRPLDRRIRWHLCSDDAIELLREVKPELAVMVHMGMLFVRHSPEEEAARIERESGVKTVPGHVGTRVVMDEEIKVNRPTRQPSLESFTTRV